MVRVTQKDIAEVMGVSVMTISNAFNRPDQLSPDLRERVLARAAKMGYTGPIGLQCYGIPGDVRDNLAESMKAWRSYSARLD